MTNTQHQRSTLKPSKRPIARGFAADDGDGYAAQWSLPGRIPEILRDADGKERRFKTEMEARLAAFTALGQAYVDENRNVPSKTKRLQHPRPTTDEFAAGLAGSGLNEAELAEIIGSNPQRVFEWKTGMTDAPFYFFWLFDLLTPQALDHAIDVTARRGKASASWNHYRANMSKMNRIIGAVRTRRSDLLAHAAAWEAEHVGQEHPYRGALLEVDEIDTGIDGKTFAQRMEALERCAGVLGLGSDINAEIEKQNAPFRVEIDKARRQRLSRERAEKRSMQKPWVDPYTKDRGQ